MNKLKPIKAVVVFSELLTIMMILTACKKHLRCFLCSVRLARVDIPPRLFTPALGGKLDRLTINGDFQVNESVVFFFVFGLL